MIKSCFDCIPCLVSQAIETVQNSTEDKEKQRIVINHVLHFLEKADFNISSPELLKQIHGIIDKQTGCIDPYKNIKLKYNRIVMEKYEDLKRLVYLNSDPIFLAVKLAAMGNTIDFKHKEKDIDINKIIENAQNLNFQINDYHIFMEDLARYKNIIYLTDNSVEIIFDKLLIEILKRFYPECNHNFTVVVRGFPLINEATIEDAELIDLKKMVNVIDSGDRMPAEILRNFSNKIEKKDGKSELIIAKGHGNFEILYNEKKLIYFIFKVNCSLISRLLNTSEGSIVLKRNLDK